VREARFSDLTTDEAEVGRPLHSRAARERGLALVRADQQVRKVFHQCNHSDSTQRTGPA
jgi:hypothetical protein